MTIPIPKPSFLLIAALALSACASQGRDRPPPRSNGDNPQRTAYSGFAAKPMAMLIATMDADGDYLVTSDEFEVGCNVEWNRLSQGGRTGALDFAKWSKAVLGSPDALPSFVSFDRNLDGTISKIEFTDLMSQQFVTFDQNSDGAVERYELVFRIEAPRSREGQRSGRQSGRGGGREGGNRPPPR